MARAIAIDGIFGQRAAAPCIDTTHTMDIQVDIDIDKLASVQLIGMLDAKVFLSIVPHTDT